MVRGSSAVSCGWHVGVFVIYQAQGRNEIWHKGPLMSSSVSACYDCFYMESPTLHWQSNGLQLH